MIESIPVLDVQKTESELYNEIMNTLVPEFEAGQNSYVKFDLDWIGEDEEVKYPKLIELMKENNLTKLLILIWW